MKFIFIFILIKIIKFFLIQVFKVNIYINCCIKILLQGHVDQEVDNNILIKNENKDDYIFLLGRIWSPNLIYLKEKDVDTSVHHPLYFSKWNLYIYMVFVNKFSQNVSSYFLEHPLLFLEFRSDALRGQHHSTMRVNIRRYKDKSTICLLNIDI